jgi:hypothetical protein
MSTYLRFASGFHCKDDSFGGRKECRYFFQVEEAIPEASARRGLNVQ